MRQLFKELGIPITESADLVIDLAWAVHELRDGERAAANGVGRLVTLFAAAMVDPSIVKRLDPSGKGFSEWARALRLKEPTVTFRGHAFRPSQRLEEVIRANAGEWRTDPPDAVAIARAILRNREWEPRTLMERFGMYGDALDISTAPVPTPVQHSLDVERTPPPADFPATHLPFQSLGEFSLSSTCSRVLERALGLASEIFDRQLITTSVLLSEIFLQALEKPRPNAFAVILDTLDESREATANRLREWLVWYRGQKLPETAEPVITRSVHEIIAEAARIAMETRGATGISPQSVLIATISARHLLAAVARSSAGSRELLRWLQISPGRIIDALWIFLVRATESDWIRDDLQAWRRILELPEVDDVGDHTLTDTTPDLPTGPDYLGFERDVDAFAMLIASNTLKPPLSIGVFGDWGAGKSYFMRKLRDTVATLAEGAEKQVAREEKPSFHRRIVQIEFNAWHYVEANLWASLVENIFRNLKTTTESGDEDKQRQMALMKELDAAVVKRMAAQTEVDRAQAERDAAVKKVQTQRAAAESAGATMGHLLQADPWDVIEIDEESEAAPLRQAFAELGVGRVANTVSDLRKLTEETATMGGQARALWTWMFSGSRAWLRIGLLVIALFAAPLLVPLILSTLAGIDLTAWNKRIAEVTTFVVGVSTWLARYLARGRELLKKVDTARTKIDEKLKAVEVNRRKRIQLIEKGQESAEQKLQYAIGELRKMEDNVRRAERVLADAQPDRQLARFIEERVASDDYRKLLGLLALVRDDFDQLSKMMQRQTGVNAVFRLDRIVLYIDDLDRCPPARVVEVLQAVHLLLAFDLFVVVVGVDARWVSKSLERKYRDLLRAPASPLRVTSRNRVPGYQAEPQDYLEKIFQVPFWIRPMTSDTTEFMIRKIASTRETSAAPPPPPQPPVPSGATESVTGGAATTTPETAFAAGESAAPPPMPSLQPPPPIPLAAMTQPRSADARLSPAKLDLTTDEVDAMAALSWLVGRSPRAVKRFVNVYKLIRAAKTRTELAAFLDPTGSSAPYERTLLLLGIMTAAAGASVGIFEQLLNPKRDELLTTLANELAVGNGPYLEQRLIAAKALIEFASDKRENARCSEFRDQARAVSRFSFRQMRLG